MPLIHCRKGTSDDAVILTDISRTTFYDTYHSQNTAEDMSLFLSQNLTVPIIENELKDPQNTFILLFDGNQLCGYAKLSEKNTPDLLKGSSVIEIARFYTIKDRIGQGIGQKLMQQCIAIALAYGKQIIWLGVWQLNARAISFYTKSGFEIFDVHFFMLGNDKQDDWLMKKVIS